MADEHAIEDYLAGQANDANVDETDAEEETPEEVVSDNDVETEAETTEEPSSETTAEVIDIADAHAGLDAELEVSRNDFEKNLTGFLSAQAANMDAARICSNAALQHYWNYGDASLLTRFLEAMDDDFAHRAKFVKWLREFSDITIENKKFLKDRTKGAVVMTQELVNDACRIDFWKFSKSPPIEGYDSNDIWNGIASVLKRMEKREAKDANASKTLENVTLAIDKLRLAS